MAICTLGAVSPQVGLVSSTPTTSSGWMKQQQGLKMRSKQASRSDTAMLLDTLCAC